MQEGKEQRVLRLSNYMPSMVILVSFLELGDRAGSADDR